MRYQLRPKFSSAEYEIEKVRDLASWAEHQYMPFALGVVAVKTVAGHLQPAPLTIDPMEFSDVLELAHAYSKSSLFCR